MSRIPLALGALAATLALGACVKSPSAPADPNAIRPAVLRIVPASASTGVDPTKPVTITFSYPMMTGMEMLVVLHEGTVTGPQVAGSMMNGQWGPGMMGTGWRASDGTFGMFFTFATA